MARGRLRNIRAATLYDDGSFARKSQCSATIRPSSPAAMCIPLSAGEGLAYRRVEYLSLTCEE